MAVTVKLHILHCEESWLRRRDSAASPMASRAKSTGLYPSRAAHRKTLLGVSNGHRLSVCEFGCTSGIPVVYLHGGPGGGTPSMLPRLFDPTAYRVVTFDQRGCGESQCDDRLMGNTLNDLIDDVDKVREHLGIERCCPHCPYNGAPAVHVSCGLALDSELVCWPDAMGSLMMVGIARVLLSPPQPGRHRWGIIGSSYGTLIGALYASRFPDRTSFLLLHGVFLGSRAELRWLYQDGGAALFYPEQWCALEHARNSVTGNDTPAVGAASGSAHARIIESPTAGVTEETGAVSRMCTDAADAATGVLPGVPPALAAWYALVAPPDMPVSWRRHPMPSHVPAEARALVASARALTHWEEVLETLEPQALSDSIAEMIACAQASMAIPAHARFRG